MSVLFLFISKIFLMVVFFEGFIRCGSAGVYLGDEFNPKKSYTIRNEFDSLFSDCIAFIEAIQANDADKVEQLLKNNHVDPSYRNNYAIASFSAVKNEKILNLLLETGMVDPSAQNNIAIIHASSFGDINVIKALLKHPKVNPAAQNNLAFQNAVSSGRTNVVKLLLSDKRVNPADNNNAAILKPNLYNKPRSFNTPSVTDQYEILSILLKDGRIDPAVNNNAPLNEAIKNARLDLVKLLLSDERVNPADPVNPAAANPALFSIYNEKESFEILELLLQDSRVDPSKAFQLAVQSGKSDMVKLLLKDKRVNPAKNNNEVIIQNTLYNRPFILPMKNQYDTLELLLKDGRADPSAYHNFALNAAIRSHRTDLIKLLLADKRVNPADPINPAFANFGLFSTSNTLESIEIMELLLQDGRADPSINSNEALKKAVFYSRKELVKLLLSDERVNPADNNNAAMRAVLTNDGTAYHALNERFNVLKLLLEDGRADPTINNNEIYNHVREIQGLPLKELLERDERVRAIEYLNTGTEPLTTTTFLDLFNSPLKLSTASYLETVFLRRPKNLVPNFLSDLLKIPLHEAQGILNLDDLDKYMYAMHKEVLNNEQSLLLERKREFLWRYYGVTLSYKDHSTRFQDLTVYIIQSKFYRPNSNKP